MFSWLICSEYELEKLKCKGKKLLIWTRSRGIQIRPDQHTLFRAFALAFYSPFRPVCWHTHPLKTIIYKFLATSARWKSLTNSSFLTKNGGY